LSVLLQPQLLLPPALQPPAITIAKGFLAYPPQQKPDVDALILAGVPEKTEETPGEVALVGGRAVAIFIQKPPAFKTTVVAIVKNANVAAVLPLAILTIRGVAGQFLIHTPNPRLVTGNKLTNVRVLHHVVLPPKHQLPLQLPPQQCSLLPLLPLLVLPPILVLLLLIAYQNV